MKESRIETWLFKKCKRGEANFIIILNCSLVTYLYFKIEDFARTAGNKILRACRIKTQFTWKKVLMEHDMENE